jgi:nucleoside-diphosphate-sugar epimerase
MAGRAVVAELEADGYELTATDLVPPGDDLGVDVRLADLTDYDRAREVLERTEADGVFPDVPRRRDIGESDSPFSIEWARAVLGLEPRHSWRSTAG